MKWLSLIASILAELLLADCTRELKTNTSAIGLTITELQTAQIQQNVDLFNRDYYSIPSQYELGNGSSGTTNLVTTGASPSIAFRAIAFTGFTATDGNQISQGWALSPITNMTDLRRLQVLYQYAVGPDNMKVVCSDNYKQEADMRKDLPTYVCTYSDLIKQLSGLFYVGKSEKDDKSDASGSTLYKAIATIVGPLPSAPPLIVKGPECKLFDRGQTSWKGQSGVMCFREGRLSNGIVLDPNLVRARFKLWITASTQRLQKEKTTKTVIRKGKKIVVPAEGSIEFLRREPLATYSAPGSLATVPQ